MDEKLSGVMEQMTTILKPYPCFSFCLRSIRVKEMSKRLAGFCIVVLITIAGAYELGSYTVTGVYPRSPNCKAFM
jgi:hypothetical protein